MAVQTISNIRLQPPRVKFCDENGYITAEWWRWLNNTLIAQQNTEQVTIEGNTDVATGAVGSIAALSAIVQDQAYDVLSSRGDLEGRIASLEKAFAEQAQPAPYIPSQDVPFSPAVPDMVQKIIDLETMLAGIPSALNLSCDPFVWTPTIAGSSTPGSQTYTSQIGSGLKIGNLVVAFCQFSLSAKDVATAGNLQVRGLPYQASGITNTFYAGMLGAISNVALSVGYSEFTCGVSQGTSAVSLFENGASVGAQNVVAASLNNTTSMALTVVYRTN